jgi:hypothetical protein
VAERQRFAEAHADEFLHEFAQRDRIRHADESVAICVSNTFTPVCRCCGRPAQMSCCPAWTIFSTAGPPAVPKLAQFDAASGSISATRELLATWMTHSFGTYVSSPMNSLS